MAEIKRLWEERAQAQRRQFLQTNLNNFNAATKAVLRMIPKGDDEAYDTALNYLLDAAVEVPVQVACSWAGHSQEIEEGIVAGIRKFFAQVRERAVVRDAEGNKIEATDEEKKGE